MNNPQSRKDYTDRFLEEWAAARPELRMKEAEPLIRVMRLAGVLDRNLIDLAKKHGINTGQFQVLAALRRRHPVALSPSDLSKIAILTTGTMTVLLDRLEDKSLVSRQRIEGDRRRIDVGLTPKGAALIDVMLNERAQKLRDMAAQMPEDLKRVTSDSLRSLLLELDPDT